jgi:hypothetical protein
VTDAPESRASGCGAWLVYFVLLSLTAKGVQRLPWPTWLQIVVFLVAWVIISAPVYGTRRRSEAPQVPPSRPAPLSAGAEVSDNRPEPEPEPTRPEAEPRPEPTKPPEPEPLKPEATSEETVDKLGDKAERLGYRLGTAIGLLFWVAIVAGLVGGVWWLFVAK